PFVWVELGPVAAAAAAALGGSAYAVAAFGVLHLDVRAAIAWLSSSQHGFRSPLWKAPAGAVFGIAHAVGAAPYPYEAGPARTFWQALVGVAAIAVATLARIRHERAPRGLEPRSLWALVLPYALVGLLFFPSEC